MRTVKRLARIFLSTGAALLGACPRRRRTIAKCTCRTHACDYRKPPWASIPTWRTAQLHRYSAKPWPEWGVPAGYLTPHGRRLMNLFGAYDRAYFLEKGLFRSR